MNRFKRSRWVTRLRQFQKESELGRMLEYIGQMMDAGIDVRRACAHVGRVGTRWSQVLAHDLETRIERGQQLSDSFGGYLQPVDLAVLRSSEHTGQFANGLLECAKRIQHRHAWLSGIMKTIAYPLMLLFGCYALAIFIHIQVLPELRQLESQFTENGSSSSWQVVSALPITFLTLCSILPVVYASLEWLRRHGVYLPFSLPFDGIRRMIRTERFAYLVSQLLAAGIPLADAIAMTETPRTDAAPHSVAPTPIHRAVLEGQALSVILSSRVDFDAILVELVGVGESTGDMAQSMHRAALLLQQRILARLGYIASWLEPGLTVVMGMVVGCSVFSVFGPMYAAIGQFSSN